MEGSAPKEVARVRPKETGNVVQFVPMRDAELREKVAGHVQKIHPSFTPEQATPSAAQPIPDLEQAGVVRPDAEPVLSGRDIKHIVDTAGVSFSGVNPDTYDRTIPGNKVLSFIRRRIRRFREGNNQQEINKAA